MTLLAADIGNSHTVLGLVDDGEVDRATGGSPPTSAAPPTSGRCCSAACSATALDDVDGHRGVRDRAGGAPRVAGDARRATSPTCRSVVVEPGVRTGVPVLMDNPREVGADRIINALAAATTYGGPAIVVDFGGTATTFDVVSAQGRVRRRRDRPGNRDLARGARPARRPAAQGRIGSGRAR